MIVVVPPFFVMATGVISKEAVKTNDEGGEKEEE